MEKKEKLPIKERLKRYFTEEPHGDVWKWAFIYLLFFRYFTPLFLVCIMFFTAGLAAPGLDVTDVSANLSESISNIYSTAFQLLFDAGAGIATNHPIISKVLFFAINNVVWVFYIGFIGAVLHLLRYFISWMYLRKEKKNERKT